MSVKHLNHSNFEEEILGRSGVSLVDFYADWCGPCQMLAPVIEEIAGERSDLVVGKINVDESKELAKKYRVMSIPTLLVFRDGELISSSMGFSPKEEILAMLDA